MKNLIVLIGILCSLTALADCSSNAKKVVDAISKIDGGGEQVVDVEFMPSQDDEIQTFDVTTRAPEKNAPSYLWNVSFTSGHCQNKRITLMGGL